MAKLSRKQQRFVDEYLIDLNATQAAIRAGYKQSEYTDTNANKILSNPAVQEYMKEKLDEEADFNKKRRAKVIDCLERVIESQKTKTMKKLKAAEMLLERYKFNEPTISEEEKAAILIDSVAVLIGECEIERKYAAMLLVKNLLPSDVVENILNDERVYPFDRNDPRVLQWTKDIKSRGYCEQCGATENLEAHHIIKWADYPKGRVDLKNGMCFCHKCHTEQHKNDKSYWMMKAKESG